VRAPQADEGQEEAASGVTIRVLITPEARRAELVADARAGLTGAVKSLPPNWFYDELGSQLFEEITRLPEYYPTRTESAILRAHGAQLIELCRAETLVELGSGVSEKTRFLLDEMAAATRLEHFVPLDVSEETLRGAALEIHEQYGIPVTGVVGDFRRDLAELARGPRRLVCFLGGTIGNLMPANRARFLVDLEATMSHDDWFLLGTDLVKDPARLVAAYDDAAGVTASFNKNVLRVLNRELGANFDLDAFQHVATWNEAERWIEMRLRSLAAQVVEVAELETTVQFAEGEEMLTEISAKFTPAGIATELEAANFVIEASYTDAAGDFLLTLAHPYC
jgi:L-histidine N-alpha-methyltransferase